MPTFQQNVHEYFPGARGEKSFLEDSKLALSRHGFEASNTIACVGVCRDELCRSLPWSVRDLWGEAFSLSGLAGMLTSGMAGFAAAHQHAPTSSGRERYLYIVMAHIGITEQGEMGACSRDGRDDLSPACGALTSMLSELQSGSLKLGLDADNIEYSILKQRLTPRLLGKEPENLDIATLTLAMCDLLTDDLKRMIERTVDTDRADYAALTGVQIHRKNSESLIWSNASYACVQGDRHEL